MRESLKESVPFFKTIWLALNPWRYEEVRDKGTSQVFKYFFSFIFVVFVLSVLLMLPAIGSFVQNQAEHFETLEVKVNSTMKSPMIIPEKDPFVTIDTRISKGELKEGSMLITDEYVYWKLPLGPVQREKAGNYSDILGNTWMPVLMVLLMLPSLLFIFYLLYAVKILLLVLLAALTGFIVARLIKFEIMFRNLIKVGLLAATPMIIIDLIKMPFGFNVYFAEYIAFAVFFIVGMIKAGEFEGGGRRSSPRRGKSRGGKGRYVDLTRKL